LHRGLSEVVRGLVLPFDPELEVESDGFLHERLGAGGEGRDGR
jgi:hypothetical protein